ncbi:MAG: hypothetical protein ACREN8_13810 [Candidatus Dormibacteraceae bacterium]
MTRDGFHVVYHGVEYEASLNGDEIRLYTTEEVAGEVGFEEIYKGRWRKVIPASEAEDRCYIFTLCRWRGEICRVVYQRGDRLRVEYMGGKATIGERLDFKLFDHGVYQGWATIDEVQELREERLQL